MRVETWGLRALPCQLPQPCGQPQISQLPSGLGCPSLLIPVTVLFLPSLLQEKNLGPSRRSPGTPRPPGASKGGRTPPQQGGRAGMGRAARSWEDSSGEQPRGGAGGRGRRGRGRGSPHLSGAGDASAADRKSKVEARGSPESFGGGSYCVFGPTLKWTGVRLSVFLSLSHRVFQCLRLLFLSFLPPSLPLTSASALSLSFYLPLFHSVCCMLPAPSLLLPCLFPLSFWRSVSVQYSYARALLFSLCLTLS